MTKTLVGLGLLALLLTACGDTRSNRELNGVATWPGGGPAFGPWREPTYTYSYAPYGYGTSYGYAPYGYGTSETTTTTTTVRPGYR